MPIEFVCQSCNNSLRVEDQFAGKQARCPSCGHINNIPSIPPTSEEFPATAGPSESKPAPSVDNPYSATSAPTSRAPISVHDSVVPFKPLYDCVFYIKFVAWYFIIFGFLYCLTIVGIVVAWAIIWFGLCLKNAARDIEIGYPSNNPGLLHAASVNLGTAAKIAGVFCMIGLALTALYIVIVIFAVIIGVANG